MKRFFSFFILTLVILFSSCVEDKTSLKQEEIAINFNLNADNFTRAYGDGTTVRDLEYAIFSKADFDNGNYSSPVDGTHKEVKNAFSATHQTAVIVEKLGMDHEYVAVFWADAENDNYSIDWPTPTMEIEDTDKLSAQDEAADAFFAVYKFIANEEHIDSYVELKRPFAQLNIATSNMEAAVEALGAELTQTAVRANTFTKLDLASGVASEPAECLFNFAAIPTGDNTIISVRETDFTRIATCYILVNKNSTEDEDVTIYLNDENYYRTFSDIKLYRNLRTNIVGNVFSGTTEIEGVESPKNVSHKDGKFRVQLTWEAPSVAGYTTRITWTQDGVEKSMDVDASLGKVIIKDLPEGDHTFTLINIDSNDATSYETTEIAHAFGEFVTRTLKNTAYDANTETVTLIFDKTVDGTSPWSEGKETVIKYTNINGTETTKTIANADQRVVCDNIGIGVTISYYTAYESENGCELLDEMNGPTLTTVTTTGFDVKVMTWNVCCAWKGGIGGGSDDGYLAEHWGGFLGLERTLIGHPWRIRRAAIAETIKNSDADVIFLQEMNCTDPINFFRDILQLLNGNGANLGYSDSYYDHSTWPVETYNGNTYYGLMIKRGSSSGFDDEGNAIIFKKSMFTDVTSNYDKSSPVGYFWLSNTPNSESIYPNANCKRICLYKRLKHNATGKEFVVACTHIDNSHDAEDAPDYTIMNGQVQILINNLRANILTTDEQRAYEDTAEADKIGRCPVIIGGDMNANPDYSSIQRFGYNKAGGYRTIANPEGNTTIDNDFADTYNVAINGAATMSYPSSTVSRSTMIDIKYDENTKKATASQNGAAWDYIFMRWGNTVKSYQIHYPFYNSFVYNGSSYEDVFLSDHNAVSAVINLQYYE